MDTRIRNCQHCGTQFRTSNTRGRPPAFCSDECRREGKRLIHNNPRTPRGTYPPCCLDHQAAGNGGRCPQHETMAKVRRGWKRNVERAESDSPAAISRSEYLASVEIWDEAGGRMSPPLLPLDRAVPAALTPAGPDEGYSSYWPDLDTDGHLAVNPEAAAAHPWHDLVTETVRGKPRAATLRVAVTCAEA